MNVLVVDDQRSARRVLRTLLALMEGVAVVEAGSVEEANAVVERGHADLALLDVRLSQDPRDRGGLDLLRGWRARGIGIPAVMVTSLSEIHEVRDAMRSGANDYVFKDELSPELLLPIVRGFQERLDLGREVTRLREQVERIGGVSALVGASPAMERLRKLVLRIADAEAPVLLRGETGTGKELVARAIHASGVWRSGPFVAVNVSALPGPLIESLLFGHERGAFTGADRRARGQFELAAGGTLLLDEIAEMPLDLQAKLLRVLESRRFRTLGAEEETPLTARVLAATHVDLERRIREGRFREDLFYRLNVVTLHLPSLAERDGDVPSLVQAFAATLTRRMRFTEDALDWFVTRPWPGNVRELRNVVERLALLADDDEVDARVCEELAGAKRLSPAEEIDHLARALLALPERLGSKLDVIERAVLHHAIEACGGNKSAAARMVGVDRKALERRWDRLEKPRGE